MRLIPIIVATAAIALCAKTSAQPEWTLIDLGPATSTANFDFPQALNNQGDVAGGWRSLWDNNPNVGRSGWFHSSSGVITVLTSRESNVAAMTENQFLVGYIDNAGSGQSFPHATYWPSPGASPEQLASGRGSRALDVNESRVICGQLWPAAQRPSYAAVWEPPYPSGAVQKLRGSITFVDAASAEAISDTGAIAGWVTKNFVSGSRTSKALLWTSSNANPITLVPAGAGLTNSRALDIDNAGRVLVRAQDAAGNWNVCIWENGVLTVLGTLGYDLAVPRRLNEYGDIVGVGVLAGAASAFLYRNGQVIDLPSHTPGLELWDLTSAENINDEGQVIGWGEINGVRHGFVLVENVCEEPQAFAELILLDSGDDNNDDDEGLFVIDFGILNPNEACADTICTGELVCGTQRIAVVNGQLVEIEVDDEGYSIEVEDGILEIEGPNVYLEVTCTNSAGSDTVIAFPWGLGPDNDAESEPDD